MFGPNDNLYTLDTYEDCRIWLYQNMTDHDINSIDLKDGMSILHRLIRMRRPWACLAVLDEKIRFKQVNHVPKSIKKCHALDRPAIWTSESETCLMAAIKEFSNCSEMRDVCFAILAREDFSQVNVIEIEFGMDDGGYTALDYSVLMGVPEVGLELLRREEFVMVNNISPNFYSSLIHALNNDHIDVALGILQRSDFKMVNQRCCQPIECTAYQIAAKKNAAKLDVRVGEKSTNATELARKLAEAKQRQNVNARMGEVAKLIAGHPLYKGYYTPFY